MIRKRVRPITPKETQAVPEELEAAKKAILYALKRDNVTVTGGVGFFRNPKGDFGITVAVQLGHKESAEDTVLPWRAMGIKVRIREQGFYKPQGTRALARRSRV